ncbi:MAG: hypothetical protein SNJ84_05335 [Verrucomicrobiia bacterium]
MEYWLSRITIALVLMAGCVVAILAASWAVEGAYTWLAGLLVFCGLMTAFAVLNTNFWLIIPFALNMPGAFNFLPIPFSFLELSIVLVATQFFLNRVVLEKRGISLGPPALVIPLVAFGLLVGYHWLIGGTGLRIFGGDTFGARRNFAIALAVLAYFIVSNMNVRGNAYLRAIPAFYLAGVFLGTAPYFFTSVFPSTAPYVNYFLGNVNVEAYTEFQSDMIIAPDADLGRVGQLVALGNALLLCLVAYFPVRDWWRPARWWVLGLALAGLFLVLRGGFRSALFHYLVIGGTAAWLSLRWKSVLPAMMGGLTIMVLAQLHGNLIHLPLSVQRTISFMPGNWDYTVMRGVESSNDFRQQIQHTYLREGFWESPWIGNGFKVDRREIEQAVQQGIEFHGQMDPIRGFIARKDFHVGWISLYDCGGVVGCVFFAWMVGAMCWLFYKRRWALEDPKFAPLYTWLLCLFAKEILGYFVVFGAIHSSMTILTVMAGFLVAMGDRPGSEGDAPVGESAATRQRTSRELVPA